MTQSRRDFLKLMATSTLGAVIFSGCQIAPRKLEFQSPNRIPEDLVSGVDNYYATVCQQCSAGCGILVRIMEGRAKKIEGNPDFPTNDGKHCAHAEASLQSLYHPERLSSPMRRTGNRGSGQFQSISWDDALNELTNRLNQLQGAIQPSGLIAITEPITGTKALILTRFLQAFGGAQFVFEPFDNTITQTAFQRTFGQDRMPEFSFEDTQYLLSFGADFLSTWLSPVSYGRKYGQFRQGQQKRGFLVQVEPRFSTTAANADIWLPIRPGMEGILALSLAQVIISEGLGDRQASQVMTGGDGASALNAFDPKQVAGQIGIDEDRIRQLARDFATNRPSLALGGGPSGAYTNGLFNLQAVYALNFLVGSVGSRGGVLFNPGSPIQGLPATARAAPLANWQQLVNRLETGQPSAVGMVMVHNANPVYGLPASIGFSDALAQAPYVVSFSSFMDETTALADLILPDHYFLEDWGDSVPDPGPGYEVIGLQQPVVRPTGDTRGFADVLLTLAEEVGGDVQRALPWNTFYDALRVNAQNLQGLNRGSVQGGSFDEYWNNLLQHGGWWDEGATAKPTSINPPALPRQAQLPDFAGSETEFPFNLIAFPSNSLRGGQFANLSWLQALPDPITTVAWESWLEVNPQVARQMGVQTGDILAVESPNGSLEAPVYVNPANPPGIVSMPAGQGHTQFTSYAAKRGSNPLDILAPLTDSETGTLAWAATRVKLRKTGRSIRLPRFEGVVIPVQLPDAEVVQTVRS